MTNPNDPIVPRKRNRYELMMLHQEAASHSQGTGSMSMPSGLEEEIIGGLTKREYFAAMAMQGQIASMTNAEVVKAWQEGFKRADIDPYQWQALSALRFADALIKELSK